MKRLLAIFLIAAGAPALADEPAFRACVAAVDPDAEAAGTKFQRCAASWAAECGDRGTAKEAAQCMLDISVALSAVTEVEFTRLGETLEAAELAEIRDGVETDRMNGDAACQALRERDEGAGVAAGQTAVNNAFCRVLSAGEAAGAAVVYQARK